MRIFLFFIWMGMMGLYAGCTGDPAKIERFKKEAYCLDEAFKKEIELLQPSSVKVTEEISLTGNVEPNPDNVVHFISLVSGVISNTYFSLGDEVTKGQVLADLRSTELSSLQAELKSLESKITLTERKLEAVQSMFEEGVSALKELMETQSELEILKSEKEKVDANLTLFSASEEKGVFQIRAPTTGIITEKSISAGTQISGEGPPLFTVSDLSQVWIMVNVYATNVQSVEKGMPVDIRTLSYPDEVFSGEIAAIPQVLDNDAKVLKARVVLPNADLKLKPGMLVDVTALRKLDTHALSIPTSVMIFDNNRNYVMIHRDGCDNEIREIEILTQNKDLFYIKEGLEENEKVISKNQLLIYEQIKNFHN